MDGRTSVTEENEKVYHRVAVAIVLGALAVGAWLLFATVFADDMSTYCGANCTGTTTHPTTTLGVLLGAAVSLTVSAAAVGLLAAMTAMHNEQMRALRDR